MSPGQGIHTLQEFERDHLNRAVAGKGGLAVTLLVTTVMCALSAVFSGSVTPANTQSGICLPSPIEWTVSPILAATANIILGWTACLGMISLNKRFNFIPGTSMLYASVFMTAMWANPWTDSHLSSSAILVCIVLGCTHILFNLYGRRNASQGIFAIFSLLSWGSMTQYACLLLMPIFMLGAVFLKSFRPREFAAALLGIAAPYWIMLGSGLLPPESLRYPELTSIFSGFTPGNGLKWLLATNGTTAVILIAAMLANSIRANSMGVKMRAYHSFINLLGAAMIWYMLFDLGNITAYTATLALCLGFQAARYFQLSRLKRTYIYILAIQATYIILFILSLS